MRTGMPKSMSSAMAPPRISASEVETEASPAVESSAREALWRMWSVAASARQSPVTMPRWAALCCRIMSIRVERVTIQSSA